VRSRLVALRSRLGPASARSLACGCGSFASHRLTCDASVRRPVGGPPAGRSRRRGLGGSPSTCTRARNGAEPCRQEAGRNRGVLVQGEARPCRRVSRPRYDSAVDLVIGAGKLGRTLQDIEALVESYRTDNGLRYLDYRPLTPPDRMVPEDLAVTIPDQLTRRGDRVQGRPGPRPRGPPERSRAVPSRTPATASV
jgi:hypothetical protein